MNIKTIIRFFKILAIAIGIEILVFDFSDVKNIITNSGQILQNEFYTMETSRLENWTQEQGVYVSEPDPMIIIENVNQYVNNVEIDVIRKNGFKEPITVFYSTDMFSAPIELLSIELNNNRETIYIRNNVYSLRVDLGETAGSSLEDCIVTINPCKLHFSLSRVVAMMIIYYLTGMLFCLHKSPDYGLEKDEEVLG